MTAWVEQNHEDLTLMNLVINNEAAALIVESLTAFNKAEKGIYYREYDMPHKTLDDIYTRQLIASKLLFGIRKNS